ncbi:YebB family permuted papain-like enzyme [Cupriavidus metallidurans]|uniref:YebB family permuted papain-like enzyme n=1 Tax=Cupriavidus metallidurans TaxID=119219 RepID=UPI001CCB36BB|nr:YebB family permuted papain-like enzyme [Cupriavidus metallidurans]UBM09655.1 YebB family permuted papain-like enzyme [Cupriavidus metallidurans]
MQIDSNVLDLATTLQVGDIVFIRVRARPFREVATATASWTNHVGIVVANSGTGTSIAESTFPLSRTTSLKRFAARSEHGRIAIARLRQPLTASQQLRLSEAVRHRMGIWYDTGFNLHSRRQFCSRFVREVLAESADIGVGEAETFKALLARQPDAALGFWRLWYFGRIPWERETVTPASLLRSPALELLFDGTVQPAHAAANRSGGAKT